MGCSRSTWQRTVKEECRVLGKSSGNHIYIVMLLLDCDSISDLGDNYVTSCFEVHSLEENALFDNCNTVLVISTVQISRTRDPNWQHKSSSLYYAQNFHRNKTKPKLIKWKQSLNHQIGPAVLPFAVAMHLLYYDKYLNIFHSTRNPMVIVLWFILISLAMRLTFITFEITTM